MSCPACAEYDHIRTIATPDELRAVIDWAARGLAADVLIERKSPVKAYEDATSFPELAKGGPWDDGMEYHFACVACGQEFALHAETYHGRGGAWSKVEDLPWYGKAPVMAKGPRPSGLTVFFVAAAILFALLLYYVKAPA
jgi:hypothetical protein